MFKESAEPIMPENRKIEEPKLDTTEEEERNNDETFEKRCFSENMRDRLFYFLATKFSSQINQYDLEEIIQETLLKAYRARNRYDSERGELSTWLFHIAKNTALNHLKKISRRSKEYPEEEIDKFPEGSSSVENRLGAKEEVAEYLKKLSYRRKTILELHFIEGLTYAEIAEKIGVKYQTIGSTITKARKQMRSARKKNIQETN